MPQIPSTAVGALLAAAPRVSSDLVRLLWRGGFVITGSVASVYAGAAGLDALAAARCAALVEDTDPHFVDRLVRAARQVQSPADHAALHAAALFALGRAAVLRWITANAAAVADAPAWRAMLPGLGGITVSVPLAEEALDNVTLARQRLPPELTASLQLNPWFSARFAARYRRRMKGKRIRIRERAATSRGWSHARTIVDQRLPHQWRSLHGRGVGRPLDRWSSSLLTAYVEQVLETFDHGVPAVVAPLLVVAAAVAPNVTVPEEAATPWAVLPHNVEEAARRLVGLPPRSLDPRDERELAALQKGCLDRGEDLAFWHDRGTSFARSGTLLG